MKTMRSIAALVFVLLLVPNAAFAQPLAVGSETPYLDFGQFSTVAPEDQLSFLDKLKWAGMNIVGAPAAGGIVSLYEYDSAEIKMAPCSQGPLQDHHALLVWRQQVQNSDADTQSQGNGAANGFEPVWGELSFSNACELQEALAQNNGPGILWQPIDDAKLRTISRISAGETGGSDEFHVIVTEPFFPETAPTRYFAECAPTKDLQRDGKSLCGEMLQ